MTRAREVSRLITTPPSIYATDSESSAGYLTLSSASSTYVPQNNAVFAGKNKIINGDMSVWQRGTSLGASGSQFIADRWNFYRDSFAAGITVSRQTTSDTTNLPSIQYCSRVQRDSGNTGTGGLNYAQNIETVNSIAFAGKTVTLSFWARKGANYSQTNSNLNASVYSGTGTDQALRNGFTGSSQLASQSFTLTTTWQRFSVTGNVSSSATQLGVLFYYAPTGTAGASDYFEVTGVQLEASSTATVFIPAGGGNHQDEIALCQRYYEKTWPHDSAIGSDNTGCAIVNGGPDQVSITYWMCPWRYQVEKRANPTVTIYAMNGAAGYVTKWASGSTSHINTNLNTNWQSSTKQVIILYNNASTSGIVFNAVAAIEI